jgi:hypothetical protein
LLFAGLLFLAHTILVRASSTSSFRVVVPGTAAIDGGSATWRAEVWPAEDGSRLVADLDGVPLPLRVEASMSDEPFAVVTAELDQLGTGYHFIEAGVDRRGGRSDRVVDSLLVGPFSARWAEELPCALAVTVAEEAVQGIVAPVVRDQALAALRASEYFGPETTVVDDDLQLVHGGAVFAYAFSGENRIAVAGRVSLRRGGARRLAARLEELGQVRFEGQARSDAQALGAGGLGAVGCVLGPLGCVAGGVVGWIAADRYVTKKAREVALREIRGALAHVSSADLFPERAELIVGEPRSVVRLSFCDEIEIAPQVGVTGRLSAAPEGVPAPDDWGAPGVVDFGIELPPHPGSPAADIQVDLTLDAVNALLDAWTRNGLLLDLLEEAGLRARGNDLLAEYTTLRIEALEARLPPVVSMEPAATGNWHVAVGDLLLRAHDTRREKARTLAVGGRGQAGLAFDEETGTVTLHGKITGAHLTCEADTGGGVALTPCFNSVLDLEALAEGYNDRLQPGSDVLPRMDLRSVVEERTEGLVRPHGLRIESVRIMRAPEARGVVRVLATTK